MTRSGREESRGAERADAAVDGMVEADVQTDLQVICTTAGVPGPRARLHV